MCHAHTTDVCLEYFEKMRRQVYQTPKSYLSFIAAYQVMYGDSASDADQFFKLNFASRHCDAVDVALRGQFRDGINAGTRRSSRKSNTKKRPSYWVSRSSSRAVKMWRT